MAKLVPGPTVGGDWIVVCPERRRRHFQDVAELADDVVYWFNRQRYATIQFRWMDETGRFFEEADDACLATFFPAAAFEGWKPEDVQRLAVELWDKRVAELRG